MAQKWPKSGDKERAKSGREKLQLASRAKVKLKPKLKLKLKQLANRSLVCFLFLRAKFALLRAFSFSSVLALLSFAPLQLLCAKLRRAIGFES